MPILMEKVRPLTPGQEELANTLLNKDYAIVGVFGPTGTGKSLFGLAYGIDVIVKGDYKKFFVVKPMIDIVTGEEITLARGSEQFMTLVKAYLRDVIGDFIDWSKIEELISNGKLVFVDSHYLKGRTFDDAVIFMDEVQSLKPESIIEVLVRVGRNSRLIVAGDPVFQSLQAVEQDPAALIRDVLISEEKSKVVDLGIKDIVREGAKRGLRLLIEYRMRLRRLSEEEKKILDSARIHSPDADVVTVVEFSEEKKKFEITTEHVPDALIIVKQDHLGRLVGRGGERISAIEKDTGKRIRGVELTLEFANLIRAIHPVSWIWKHIVDVDFAGPQLAVKVYEDVVGAFLGQRGNYIRFIDTVMRKLMNVGVRTIEVERTEGRRRRRRR
ncbi:MAG TPA: PhoH family protein [Acidilobales archaeon]|nr:PhoH family protein [Acidilobales archaeon]